MKALLLKLSLVLSFPLLAQANDCVVRRAAFDIGSASTKLKVSDVDVCLQKILHIVHESESRVDYAQSLELSGEKKAFSPEVTRQGLAVIQKLRSEAEALGATQFAGVATAAFRSAKNAPELVAKFDTDAKVAVQIISQDQEGQVAFVGAVAKSQATQDTAAVWDVGGKSMQISTYNSQKGFEIYKGQLASVGIKNRIITEIQKKDINNVKSPNPISSSDFMKAVAMAQRQAKEVSPELRKALKSKTLLGVGGVLSKSVRNLVGKDIITQSDILTAYRRLSAKAKASRTVLDDEFIKKQTGSSYPDTDISNLALILGYMKELKLPSIQTVNANLTEGVLISPSFYAPKTLSGAESTSTSEKTVEKNDHQ